MEANIFFMVNGKFLITLTRKTDQCSLRYKRCRNASGVTGPLHFCAASWRADVLVL